MATPHLTYQIPDPQDHAATLAVYSWCSAFSYDARTGEIRARIESYRSAEAFAADDPRVEVVTLAIDPQAKPAEIDPVTEQPTTDAVPSFAEVLAAHPDLVSAVASGVYALALAMPKRFPNAQVVTS